jgi:hypothetical protein
MCKRGKQRRALRRGCARVPSDEVGSECASAVSNAVRCGTVARTAISSNLSHLPPISGTVFRYFAKNAAMRPINGMEFRYFAKNAAMRPISGTEFRYFAKNAAMRPISGTLFRYFA